MRTLINSRLAMLLIVVLLSVAAYGDGTVTAPSNVAPASWKIAFLCMANGSLPSETAGVSITIYYYDAAGNYLPTQNQVLSLTAAEVVSLLTTVESPVSGEAGTSVKKFRQRVTNWLIANGKIANVTPE